MIGETYRDVEVVYLIDENKWRFTVNGRERTAETLSKARESIDRSLSNVSQKKEQAWKPFEVWHRERYGDGFKKVLLTSVAEGRSRWDKSAYAWISNNGKRSKEPMSLLFSIDEHNNALVEKIVSLEAEGHRIDIEIGENVKQLQPVTISSEAQS